MLGQLRDLSQAPQGGTLPERARGLSPEGRILPPEKNLDPGAEKEKVIEMLRGEIEIETGELEDGPGPDLALGRHQD